MKTHETCENLQNLWRFLTSTGFLTRGLLEPYWLDSLCHWSWENCKYIAISKCAYCILLLWAILNGHHVKDRCINQWTISWRDLKAQILYFVSPRWMPYYAFTLPSHPSPSCKFNLRCIQDTSNEHVNSFPAYYMKLEAAFFLPCLQNTIVLLRPQRQKHYTLPR